MQDKKAQPPLTPRAARRSAVRATGNPRERPCPCSTSR
jgi:hypothetical protein